MKDKTWTGRNVFGLYRPWKGEHYTFLLHLLTWGPGVDALSVSSQGCTRDRGGPHYGLVHKSPLGKRHKYCFICRQANHIWLQSSTEGKEIHFCHVPPGELRHLWTVLVAAWLNSEELESEQSTGDSCSVCIRIMEREGIGSGVARLSLVTADSIKLTSRKVAVKT